MLFEFPNIKRIKEGFIYLFRLKSAPGLSAITPDPATVPVFLKALHAVGDAIVPDDLKADMNG